MGKEIAEWAYIAWGDMRHWRVSESEIIPQWKDQDNAIKEMWRNTIRETLVKGDGKNNGQT